MREFLELSPAGKTEGMILGKVKSIRTIRTLTRSTLRTGWSPETTITLLCIGAPGSGKSRGFIIPFLMAAQSAVSPRSSRMPRASFLNVFPRISGSMASM